MKRACLLAAALLLAAPSARAQVFGQLTGAEPVGMNNRLFGAYLQFSQSESALLGQMRLSFYPGIDFGFQGGLSRVSLSGHDRTSVNLGGDLKAIVMRRDTTHAFDLSLGAAIGVRSAEDFNVLSVGPTIVGSRPYAITNGGFTITPYAGAGLMFTRSDLNNGNTTDMSVPLRLGAEIKPNADVRFVAELLLALSDEIGDDVRFTVGANFPF